MSEKLTMLTWSRYSNASSTLSSRVGLTANIGNGGLGGRQNVVSTSNGMIWDE